MRIAIPTLIKLKSQKALPKFAQPYPFGPAFLDTLNN